MFHNCGAAAYGPINLKENKKEVFIYEYGLRRGLGKGSVVTEHKTVFAQRLVDLSTSVGTKGECS